MCTDAMAEPMMRRGQVGESEFVGLVRSFHPVRLTPSFACDHRKRDINILSTIPASSIVHREHRNLP